VIPLAKPVLGDREEELVLEVIRSGQLSLGPMLPRFERDFAATTGVAHASAVSSGTAGLHLALRAVGVGEGDEVVTSPFSFVASANSVLYQGARPVFADVDPVTLNLDVDAARAAVTERTTRCCRCTSSGRPPTRRRSSPSGCRSSRTPARRSAPATPTAASSAAAGTRRSSPSTPTSR
jgi:perosamine synthetase